jgi:hypothetical protein
MYVFNKYWLVNELCPVALTHILLISKFVIKFSLFNLSKHVPKWNITILKSGGISIIFIAITGSVLTWLAVGLTTQVGFPKE